MQVHVATGLLPAKSPLTRALQVMRQVIDEARNTVRGLRSSTSASLDLEDAFSRVRQEASLSGAASEVGFRFVVEGKPRALHPLLRDEMYKIGREALINAFRHAQANNVELELKYSRNQLRLLVRDDGCGIDPKILNSGRDGHWGLSGMRERADRIGARLKIWSGQAGGAEVELTVPGHVAFVDHRSFAFSLFSNRFQRKDSPNGARR